jgi:hypothetical protein
MPSEVQYCRECGGRYASRNRKKSNLMCRSPEHQCSGFQSQNCPLLLRNEPLAHGLQLAKLSSVTKVPQRSFMFLSRSSPAYRYFRPVSAGVCSWSIHKLLKVHTRAWDQSYWCSNAPALTICVNANRTVISPDQQPRFASIRT